MKIIKNKALFIVFSMYIVGIVFGIISFFLIDNSFINESIKTYFNSYNLSFNYISGLLNTNLYNLNISFFIWISGILLIGIIVSPLLLILRGLSLSFTLISIIVQFKLKGVVLALITLFSNVFLYDIVFMLLSYYSVNLSIRTFKIIKNNHSINIKSYYKNYLFRYLIFLFVLFLGSLIDIYVISRLIKYIII